MINNKIISSLLAGLFLLTSTNATAQQPLDPKEAFRFEAEVVDGDTIRATWRVADDYYIYRDKVRFESGTEGVSLGEPDFPKGKLKHGIKPDGTEGEVETYMHEVSIDVPYTVEDASLEHFTLVGHSQGCAEELGICYPPQKRDLSLQLAAAGPSGKGAAEAVSDLGSKLGIGGAGGDAEPLPPEQAFAFDAEVQGSKLHVTWNIADDYYMYRDNFAFESKTPGVTLGQPAFPKAKIKHGIKPDGTEGEVATYVKQVEFDVPITRSDAGVQQAEFHLTGQGCAEKLGICYPPQTHKMTADVSAVAVAAAGEAAPQAQATPSAPSTSTGTDDGFWTIVGYLAIAFVSGLGLTFTPCVLPMLPIISSIIVGQGENVTKTRGGVLAGIYVIGTAVVWTAAGALAGATGEQLQAYTSSPYFLIPVAVILALLSLAMFGFFNLQMPASLQSRAQEQTQSLKGGTVAGVFVMGVLASVIAGACVSPILILNLGVAMQAQDPVLGGGIMFLMALGMGVPIVLVGIGAGWLLPKAGTWMDIVKYVFGVLLIGLAIYILTLVPWMPVLYLWGIFLIVVGIYMGATRRLPDDASGWRVLWKGLGTVLLIWGVFALLGAMQGNRDILKPISFNFVGAGGGGMAAVQQQQTPLFTKVHSIEALQGQLQRAQQEGKPAILDYYADWCTDCLRMEKTTFADAEVRQRLQDNFVMVQADVTDQFDPKVQPMKDAFGVFGPPAILFFDEQGNEIRDLRTYGYKSKEKFMNMLDQVQGS